MLLLRPINRSVQASYKERVRHLYVLIFAKCHGASDTTKWMVHCFSRYKLFRRFGRISKNFEILGNSTERVFLNVFITTGSQHYWLIFRYGFFDPLRSIDIIFFILFTFIKSFKTFIQIQIWAASWQNQQRECAPSEDSEQPGHPPSLIRVFAVRMKKAWILSYPLSAKRRLWTDWADAQAVRSLCWAHSHIVGFVTRQLIHLRCWSGNTFILIDQRTAEQHSTDREALWSSNQLTIEVECPWLYFEPCHKKTCFSHMRTTKEHINLYIHAVWSAALFSLPR